MALITGEFNIDDLMEDGAEILGKQRNYLYYIFGICDILLPHCTDECIHWFGSRRRSHNNVTLKPFIRTKITKYTLIQKKRFQIFN